MTDTVSATPLRRNLQAHKKLIMDVIKRQAGTLEKAVLEGVMNSIEAEATRIDITFEVDGIGSWEKGPILRISDNGRGIVSRREIEDYFETFGTPHDEGENVIWKQFRMGRGQLFSFGCNEWRTGEFKMVVDIENMGLEYNLYEGLNFIDGCVVEIELAKNPIGTYQYTSLDSFKANLRRQIRFMNVPVFFNGEQITENPADCKWDIETNDAYYLFGVGKDLEIYNLGAFVMSKSASSAGQVGIIVSKKRLKVNFARNDVQHDCEVYRRIQEVIKENRIKRTRKSRRRLDYYERISAMVDIRDGLVDYDEYKNIGLIETTSGRRMSFEAIKKNTLPWSFAESGNRIADRLMESESVVIFDKNILDEISYTGDERNFFEWLFYNAVKHSRDLAKWKKVTKMYRPFNSAGGGTTLSDGFKDQQIILPETKLTKYEKRFIKCFQKISDNYFNGRRIVVGTSDTAAAWTDGSGYIAFARSYLKEHKLGTSGNGTLSAAKMIHTACHEASHDIDTCTAHVHDEEFYRKFHELTYGSDKWNSPLVHIVTLGQAMKQVEWEEVAEKAVRRNEKSEAAKARKLKGR